MALSAASAVLVPYFQQPFEVAPVVAVTVTAGAVLLAAVLLGVVSSKQFTLVALAGAAAFASSNAVVALALRISLQSAVSFAISSFTSGLLILARTVRSAAAVRCKVDSDIPELIIGHYHRTWTGLTQVEANHARVHAQQMWDLARQRLNDTHARIADAKTRIAPYNKADSIYIAGFAELTALEHIAHDQQQQSLNFEDVFASINAAYNSALNANIFALNTDLAAFQAMGLTERSKEAQVKREALLKERGQTAYSIIMEALNNPQTQTQTQSQAAGVGRLQA